MRKHRSLRGSALNAYVISVCLLFLFLFFIRLPPLRATARNILIRNGSRGSNFSYRAIFSGIKQLGGHRFLDENSAGNEIPPIISPLSRGSFAILGMETS